MKYEQVILPALDSALSRACEKLIQGAQDSAQQAAAEFPVRGFSGIDGALVNYLANQHSISNGPFHALILEEWEQEKEKIKVSLNGSA